MNDDAFDATRLSARRLRSEDDTLIGAREVNAASEDTLVAAPRLLHSVPPTSEVDRSTDPPVELPREHYPVRPVPTQFAAGPVTPSEGVEIPVVDVEAAQVRVRRVRLFGVIALVAAMIAVVLLAGLALAWLL